MVLRPIKGADLVERVLGVTDPKPSNRVSDSESNGSGGLT